MYFDMISKVVLEVINIQVLINFYYSCYEVNNFFSRIFVYL